MKRNDLRFTVIKYFKGEGRRLFDYYKRGSRVEKVIKYSYIRSLYHLYIRWGTNYADMYLI